MPQPEDTTKSRSVMFYAHPEDLALMDQLHQRTGIKGRSDLFRYAIRRALENAPQGAPAPLPPAPHAPSDGI